MSSDAKWPSLRRLSRAVLAAFTIVATLAAGPVLAAGGPQGNEGNQHWVGTWATGVHWRVTGASFANQTLREIVHTSIAGDRARVRISNSFGVTPLVVGSAHLALRDTGPSIVPGSDRALTFGGLPFVTIAPGAHVRSDPVALDVPALGDLAISLYLPGTLVPSTATPLTGHNTGLQTSYVSPEGNFTGEVAMPVQSTMLQSYFLMGVDVSAPKQVTAIVTLGDSITDGTRSTPDTNNRWPNHLARRLQARPGNHKMGVLDVGISGNRVLSDSTGNAGVNAQSRFDRDVLSQTGVTHVIVLEGINDSSNTVFQADLIIAGLNQIAERAHAKGLKIYAGTLTPAGSAGTREANRQAVNEWIRTSGAFDAVIEFDLATLDPANPTFFLPEYDSGDHLHPSDLGYEAMANAIDLDLFR